MPQGNISPYFSLFQPEDPEEIRLREPTTNILLDADLPKRISEGTGTDLEDSMPPFLKMLGSGMASTPPQSFDQFLQGKQSKVGRMVDAYVTAFNSTLTGQKQTSIREQLFKEYQQQQLDQQRKQQMDLTRQNVAVNATLQWAMQNKSLAQKQSEFGQKMLQDRLQFETTTKMKLYDQMIEYQKLQNDTSLGEARKDLLKAQREKLENTFSSNPYLQSASQIIRKGGKDIYDLETVNSEVIPLANKMFEAVSRQPAASGNVPGFPRFVSWKDGFGHKRTGVYFAPGTGLVDIDTNQAVGQREQVDFSNDRLKKIATTETASNNIGQLIAEMKGFNQEDLEKVISKFTNIMSSEWIPDVISGSILSEDQQRVVQAFKNIKLNKTNAITGAQVTDNERKYISSTLPPIAGGPKKFMSLMAMEGATLRAAALREKLALEPGDLEFAAEVGAIQKAIGIAFDAAKKGDNSLLESLRIPTAKEIVRQAASRLGRTDIIEQLEKSYTEDF